MPTPLLMSCWLIIFGPGIVNLVGIWFLVNFLFLCPHQVPITSCNSIPPPLFRFYELTKRWLRLFLLMLIDHVLGPELSDKKLISCCFFGWYQSFFALTEYFMYLMHQQSCYQFSHWNVMKGSFMKAPPVASKNCLFRARSSWHVTLHLFHPQLKRDNFAFIKRNK